MFSHCCILQFVWMKPSEYVIHPCRQVATRESRRDFEWSKRAKRLKSLPNCCKKIHIDVFPNINLMCKSVISIFAGVIRKKTRRNMWETQLLDWKWILLRFSFLSSSDMSYISILVFLCNREQKFLSLSIHIPFFIHVPFVQIVVIFKTSFTCK